MQIAEDLKTTLSATLENAISPSFSSATFVLILAWVSLATLACNDLYDDDLAPSSSHEVEIVESDAFEGDEPARKRGAPRKGGVFRFPGYFALIPDPVFAENFDSLLISELYSGLTRIVDDPSSSVQPDLADRWSVSEDGLIYDFVLRQDIKFSDASPVLAADFKWSWERALDPYMESHHAQEVFGSVEGARLVMNGTTRELTGIQVIDDRTLRIHLETPRADFPSLLADPVAVVLKRDNVEKWNYDLTGFWTDPQIVPMKMDELPVGTGPFALATFDANDKAVIVRNDYYAGLPSYLDGVEFSMQLEGNYYERNAAGFRLHEFDILFFREDNADKYYASNNVDFGELVFVEKSYDTRFFVFNAANAPYDDKHFRHALISASDVDSFSNERNSETARSLLPPDLPGHDPKLDGTNYDPERALKSLLDSRYFDNSDQLELEFLETTFGLSEKEVSSLADDWQETLNIDLRYSSIYPQQYVSLAKENGIQMKYISVVPQYPDPYSVLRVFDSTFGEGNQSSEYLEIESMLYLSTIERDAARRVEQLAAIEKYVLQADLALPFEWISGEYYVGVQPWVHDLEIPKYRGSIFHDVWLDDTAPERSLPR